MARRLDWAADGADWPNREASRFVEVDGISWHVQRAGSGPVLLLLHGTGSSTHSWRDLLPLLAGRFSVVAPDLPGHAFTRVTRQDALSLTGMARATGGLLRALGCQPTLVAGHSAGAAVLARMCLDGAIEPDLLVSLNGAFLPPGGLAGQMFSPVAKLLAKLPVVPDLFAWRAGDPAVMARLIRATGSTLDPAGIALYMRLGRAPEHVAGALAMMAQWELAPLLRDLPRLATKLALVVGTNDGTIPPAQASVIKRMVRGASLTRLPGLGHLAHEERPDLVDETVAALWRNAQAGLMADTLAEDCRGAS